MRAIPVTLRRPLLALVASGLVAVAGVLVVLVVRRTVDHSVPFPVFALALAAFVGGTISSFRALQRLARLGAEGPATSAESPGDAGLGSQTFANAVVVLAGILLAFAPALGLGDLLIERYVLDRLLPAIFGSVAAVVAARAAARDVRALAARRGRSGIDLYRRRGLPRALGVMVGVFALGLIVSVTFAASYATFAYVPVIAAAGAIGGAAGTVAGFAVASRRVRSQTSVASRALGNRGVGGGAEASNL